MFEPSLEKTCSKVSLVMGLCMGFGVMISNCSMEVQEKKRTGNMDLFFRETIINGANAKF